MPLVLRVTVRWLGISSMVSDAPSKRMPAILYNTRGHKLRFSTQEKAQFVTALGIDPAITLTSFPRLGKWFLNYRLSVPCLSICTHYFTKVERIPENRGFVLY